MKAYKYGLLPVIELYELTSNVMAVLDSDFPEMADAPSMPHSSIAIGLDPGDRLLSSGGTLTKVFAGSAPSAFTSREDSTFEPKELTLPV